MRKIPTATTMIGRNRQARGERADAPERFRWREAPGDPGVFLRRGVAAGVVGMRRSCPCQWRAKAIIAPATAASLDAAPMVLPRFIHGDGGRGCRCVGVTGAAARRLHRDGPTSPLRCLRRRHGIDAEFLADMSKSLRIGEAAVRHHRAQFGQSRLSEQQPRPASAGFEPHQPALHKPFGDR